MHFTMPPADVPAHFAIAQTAVIIRAAGPPEVWLGQAPERDDEHGGHGLGHLHVTDPTTPGITSSIRGSLPVDHSFTEPGAASNLAMTVGAWIAASGTHPKFDLRPGGASPIS